MKTEATLTQDLTLSEDGTGQPQRARLALVVAMLTGASDRVGEILLPPVVGSALFGRGESLSDDAHPRLPLLQIRPGQTIETAPLTLRWLSRRQLLLTGERDGFLTVRSLGRGVLRCNGIPAEQALLQEGDVLEVGRRMVLMCVRTPAHLPAIAGLALHPFGQPDADGIVGESPAAWELRRLLQVVAPRRRHVLILGQSGTGKELVAAALHRRSGVAGPLITRNAATLPEGIIDAELFGNAESYPNPGMKARPGLIGAAHGGSLFLDEIAELSVALQAHLLRVLDAGEYQRLGESQIRQADFRLLAATNRSPDDLKPDVLARFPIRIEVPTMGARKADLPLIIHHLLRTIALEEPDLVAPLMASGHPDLSPKLVRHLLSSVGADNVRGIHSGLWMALIHHTHGSLQPAPGAGDEVATWEPWVGSAGHDIPPKVLQACLDAHNGSQEQTWRALKLASRHVLGRLIRKHQLVIRRAAGA